jgi:hypothetical protein
MTKSDQPRAVLVRFDSYGRPFIDIFTANFADKIFVLQLQQTHEKAPRVIPKKPRLDSIPAAVAAISLVTVS